MIEITDDDSRDWTPGDGDPNYNVHQVFAALQVPRLDFYFDWAKKLLDPSWEVRAGTIWELEAYMLHGPSDRARVLCYCLSLLIAQDPKYDVRCMALEKEAEALNSSEIELSKQNRRYFLGDFLRAACHAPMPEMTRVRQTAIGMLGNNSKWLFEPATYNYPNGSGFSVNYLAEGLIMGLEHDNGSFPDDIVKGCVVELLNHVVKHQTHDSCFVQELRRVYGRLLGPGSSLRVANPELRALIINGFNPLGLAQGS